MGRIQTDGTAADGTVTMHGGHSDDRHGGVRR